jgi:uncharacterized repeat protein (TIGR01451 family)
MANLKNVAALLAALAILMGDGSRELPAEERPGIALPRLEITQNVVDPVRPGKPFILDLCVRNLGNGAAQSIHIFEKPPDGAELLEAAPNPSRQQNLLVWSLEALKPGEEHHIRLHLRANNVPAAGEWSNKVQVAYQCEVGSVCAIDVKRARLELSVAAPKFALRGELLPVEITVRNTGTWTGQHLRLAALVGGGLVHESGTELENEIGDLPQGQVCTIPLALNAQRSGKGIVQLRLTAEESGFQTLNQTVTIDIRDVRIDLGIHGPTTASAGWPCTYDFVLSNRSGETLPAVKLVAQMPKNLTFVRASGNGICEANSHTLTWDLPECRPGESVTCVLSGVAQDGPGEVGCLKVLHNKHVIKELPWSIRLLDRPSSTPLLQTAHTLNANEQEK